MRTPVVRTHASSSLYNFTLSPGWDARESQILCKALIKFGIGRWMSIVKSGCLPGKTVAQLGSQTQRLLGQQSTAEFVGLHIDPTVVGLENSRKVGVLRKGGVIINTGAKLTREEIAARIQANREKYELPEEVWSNIDLSAVINELAPSRAPAMELSSLLVSLAQKKEELAKLRNKLVDLEKQISELGEDGQDASEGARRKRERLYANESSSEGSDAETRSLLVSSSSSRASSRASILESAQILYSQLANGRDSLASSLSSLSSLASSDSETSGHKDGAREPESPAVAVAKAAPKPAKSSPAPPPMAPKKVGKVSAKRRSAKTKFEEDLQMALALSASLHETSGTHTPSAAEPGVEAALPAYGEDEVDAPCMVCMESWDGAAEMLDCDTCHKWYHFACVSIPAASAPPALWVCEHCTPAASSSHAAMDK